LARWPVGGIRTYFRYVFSNGLFREYALTFMTPDRDLRFWLEEFLPIDTLHFIVTKDSVTNIFFSVVKELACGRYSMVHSHGFTAGVIAAPLCSLFRMPHLMTAHDVFQPGQFVGWRGKMKRKSLEMLFRKVDAIHTATEDGTENILEYLPSLDPKKIHTIQHGIDVDEFIEATAVDFRGVVDSLGQNDYLIGFFGRFMAPKGFRYLIEAMDILVKHRRLSRRPVVLTFGDDGFYREEYAEIERRGLDDSFIRLPHTDDMPGAIKGVDLVAMPSIWEACGLLAMETLAAGVPIIGSSCVGLRKVLQDTPAVQVPPGNAIALADAIEDEIQRPRKHEFLQYVAIAKRRFSKEKMAEELSELYACVAEGRLQA